MMKAGTSQGVGNGKEISKYNTEQLGGLESTEEIVMCHKDDNTQQHAQA